jgi:hypothetical protein
LSGGPWNLPCAYLGGRLLASLSIDLLLFLLILAFESRHVLIIIVVLILILIIARGCSTTAELAEVDSAEVTATYRRD